MSVVHGIVADDLTGALDSGAALASGSGRVRVELPGCTGDIPGDVDAVVIATGARDLPWPTAEARVHRAIDRILGFQPAEFVLKIDSRLRGHGAREVKAALDALGQGAIAIVAAAYPAHRRVTRGGVQYADAVGYAPTDLVAHFAGADRPVLSLSVAQFSEWVTERYDRAALTTLESTIVVVDAETETHLDEIVRAGRMLSRTLWVGTAGLTGALARPQQRVTVPKRTNATDVEKREPRIIVIAGSASAETGAQARRFDTAFRHPVTIAEAGNGRLRLEEHIHSRGLLVLDSRFDDEDAVTIDSTFAMVLGTLVASVVDQIDGLVVSGGETALALMTALGATSLTVVGEIEAGLALSQLPHPWSLPLVTKAGSFGDDDALVRATEFLKRHIEMHQGASPGAQISS